MFCLGCGSEIPLRSEYCPVCGQRIGPQGGIAPTPKPKEAPIAAFQPPDTSEQRHPIYPSMTSDTAPHISALPGHPPLTSGSIGLGDLDGFAFPRDTPGRVALGAAAAIIVSVFLPWVSLASYTLIPIQVTTPAFVIIGAAGVAALPAFWTPVRRRLPAAVLPFGLGACLFGMGMIILTFVGPFASAFITQVMIAMTGDSLPPSSSPDTSSGIQIPISAGLGLYLFLLAAAALTVSGYFVLIEATIATAPRAQPAPMPASMLPPYPPAPAAPAQAPLPLSPTTPGSQGQGATASTPAASAPPQPGDLRWEQEIASPPVVRRPPTAGRPNPGRLPRH